jgi:hypothetical protein
MITRPALARHPVEYGSPNRRQIDRLAQLASPARGM